MGNDAQVEITKNSNDRVSESTNEFNVTNRTITILDYKVHVIFYLFQKIKRKYNCLINLLFPQGLLWSCSLRRICLTALWLPLGALIFCYVTASIFQADDIHETHCRVSYKLWNVNYTDLSFWKFRSNIPTQKCFILFIFIGL